MDDHPSVLIASVWRHHRREGETRIYVGRGCRGYSESPLGNPYTSNEQGSTLPKYRIWLREQTTDPSSPQAKELVRIARLVASGQQVTLLCWCAKDSNGLTTSDPHICHAQIVGEVVEKVAERISKTSS